MNNLFCDSKKIKEEDSNRLLMLSTKSTDKISHLVQFNLEEGSIHELNIPNF